MDEWTREALADWDERFRAWRMSPDVPISPLDECELVYPAYSNITIADVKRRLRADLNTRTIRSCERMIVIETPLAA